MEPFKDFFRKKNHFKDSTRRGTPFRAPFFHPKRMRKPLKGTLEGFQKWGTPLRSTLSRSPIPKPPLKGGFGPGLRQSAAHSLPRLEADPDPPELGRSWGF